MADVNRFGAPVMVAETAAYEPQAIKLFSRTFHSYEQRYESHHH
jgi:hypothetical protein